MSSDHACFRQRRRPWPRALRTPSARALSAAIAARGQASIAVSGGSTPKAFFQALSPADDRLDQGDRHAGRRALGSAGIDRSNQRLVKDNLLQGPAAAARFVPLYQPATRPNRRPRVATADGKASARRSTSSSSAWEATAIPPRSFRAARNLAEALDPATPRGVITMEAEAPASRADLHLLQPSGCRASGAAYRRRGKKDVLARRKAPGRGGDADPRRAAAGGLAAADLLGP